MFGIRELFESIDAAVNNKLITPDEAANIYEHVKSKIDYKLAGYRYWIKKGRPEYSILPLKFDGDKFVDDGWISNACESEVVESLNASDLNFSVESQQLNDKLSDDDLARMVIHSVSVLPCCNGVEDDGNSVTKQQYNGHRYGCPRFNTI